MAELGNFNLKTMQQVVKILNEAVDKVEKLGHNVDKAKKVASEYNAILKSMGVDLKLNSKNLDATLDKCTVRLNYMKKLAKEEEAQAKRQARLNELTEHGNSIYAEYYERVSDLTQGINKAQQEYIKGNGDAVKLENTILSKLREKQDILNTIQESERKSNAIKSTKQDAVYSLLGTNAQNVQDVKDGTYILKTAVKVFSKAVEVFKQAVEDGVRANYESTENTLNRIVANNSAGGRFSWNRGSFGIGGKSYTGYKQINNAVVDQLNGDNLYNNIGNTAIVEAAAKLTNEGGFGLEEAIAKGYQDTVIKYVVPYLDTTTEAFDSLEMLMPRNFKKCSGY